MKIGTRIKEMRMLKGKTIKEVCGNEINRGNYWRIEENRVVPKIDTFEMILKNLNLSFFEYINIFHDEEEEELISELKFNFLKKDIEKLNQIVMYCNKKYQETQRNYYLHYYCITILYINELKGESYCKKSSGILKKLLISCNYWSYYEIEILNNTLFLYEDEIILLFFNKITKIYRKNYKNKNIINVIIELSQNIIVYFIRNKE